MKTTLLSCATVMCLLLASAKPSGPIGEQLAEHSEKDSQQGKLCYKAAYNRLKHVFDANKRSLPELGAEKGKSKFTLLWLSSVDKADEWKALDPKYKACGPPGALVDAGLATLVNHKAIWEGKLEPGALVQIWDSVVEGNPSGEKANGVRVFESVLAGKPVEPFIGHAFIFLRYVKDANGKITGMRIADQGTGWDKETVTEKHFGFWVGANIK
jgi:hypothetical protein